MRVKIIDVCVNFVTRCNRSAVTRSSEKTNAKFARPSINLGELGRLKSPNRAIAELQFAAIVDWVARSIVRTSMSSFAL